MKTHYIKSIFIATILAIICVTKAYSAEVWYPEDGSWNGTAPACAGDCGNSKFAWCVGMNPGCAYSDAYSPPGFGDYCSSGRKAYCVMTALYPQVTDYKRLNEVGTWRGTAPSCSGSCNTNEFALCRSMDGKGCAYSNSVNGKELNGFGSSCWSGRKAFCVPISYIE